MEELKWSLLTVTALKEKNFSPSRHTVVCQRPRKQCDTQVCYLQELLTRQFQSLISLYPQSRFPSNHIFYALNIIMRPYMPYLKKISPVVHQICVPDNCPIFFTFYIFFFLAPYYRSKSIELTKDTLLVDQFLSCLAHL